MELLESGKIKKPPVPVEKLVSLLGIRLIYKFFETDVSGLIGPENGEVIMCVNQKHSETRQRFTIAHELGHYSLHGKDGTFVDVDFRGSVYRDGISTRAIDAREMEANAFAAELLMPLFFLEVDLKTNVFLDYESDDRIAKMAELYKVSEQALVIRLTNMKLMSYLSTPKAIQ